MLQIITKWWFVVIICPFYWKMSPTTLVLQGKKTKFSIKNRMIGPSWETFCKNLNMTSFFSNNFNILISCLIKNITNKNSPCSWQNITEIVDNFSWNWKKSYFFCQEKSRNSNFFLVNWLLSILELIYDRY